MPREIKRYGQVSDDGGKSWQPSTKGKSRKRLHEEAQRAPAPVLAYPPPRLTGRARYTAARFLEGCCEQTERMLRLAWSRGDQLASVRIPVDGLPAVLILAAYARLYGADIVDDWDALIERYQENVSDCSHNDKFFASCICILDRTGQLPGEQAFQDINVPAIYEELFA